LSTAITVSGSTGDSSVNPFIYPTYDSNQQGYQLPYPNLGNSDKIPSFMFLQGDIVYVKDKNGNVVAENRNRDGSLPV
jgi:hypothetical protein